MRLTSAAQEIDDEANQLEWPAFVLRFISVCNLSDHRDLLPLEIFPHGRVFAGVEKIDYFRMDVPFLIGSKSWVLILSSGRFLGVFV